MNFSCQKSTLQTAISTVSKAVSSVSNVSILKGILLEASHSQLRMTGSDEEITIQNVIDIDVTEAGNVVIDTKILNDIVRNLPDEMVNISVDENLNVLIKCNNVKFKIKGLDAQEFPKPVLIEQTESFTVPSQNFKNMIIKTSFAASTDELKAILTGVLFEIEAENLNMVAVDGYRLALNKCEIKNDGTKKSIVVPAKTLNEVSKLINDDNEIKISSSANNIIFEFQNTTIYSRLISGEFLNYKQIIQIDSATKVRVKTKAFQSAMERASLIIVSKENKSIPVKLNVNEDRILITANSDIGEVYEEVPCINQGKDLEIGFNPKYLIDVFKIIDEDEIILNMGSNISPCIILPVSSENFIYLILPIRLNY